MVVFPHHSEAKEQKLPRTGELGRALHVMENCREIFFLRGKFYLACIITPYWTGHCWQPRLQASWVTCVCVLYALMGFMISESPGAVRA